MIVWRRSRRQYRGRALSTAVVVRWSQRATYIGLAIGLVLMHHVVGAHQHGQGEPVPAGATAPVAAVTAPVPTQPPLVPTLAPAPQDYAGHAEAKPAPASGAALHHHDSDGDDAAVMVLLHMCMAVLAAVSVLAALRAVGSWWRTAPRRRPATRARTAPLARPPPVPLRLAQLQILRL